MYGINSLAVHKVAFHTWKWHQSLLPKKKEVQNLQMRMYWSKQPMLDPSGISLRCCKLLKADKSLWEVVIYNAPVAWQSQCSLQQPLIISWK